ncbi:hypothetical protein FJZ26_04705 [Candidatus Parvarchaeota archaeon]|nr:hypothetical protein [Candidatus Parvarchaeota archaeon]
MKLIDMTITEVKFILGMGLTSFLIMSYPFIIMILLGPAFSSSLNKIGNIPIAIYEDGSGNTGSITSSIMQIDGIKLVRVYSEPELVSKVSGGEVPLGIKVGMDGNRQSVVLYRDPQKGIIATNMIVILEELLSEQKGIIVAKSINQLQESLAKSTKIIKRTMKEFGNYKNEISNSRFALSALTNDLDGIRSKFSSSSARVESMRQSTQSSKATLAEFRSSIGDVEAQVSQIDYYVTRIDAADARLVSVYNMISDFNSKRSVYVGKIDSANSKLNNYRNYLSQAESTLLAARSSTSDQNLIASINSALNSISNAKNEIVSAQNDLNSARSDLMSVDVNRYWNEVSAARNELSATRGNLLNLKSQLSSAASLWRAKADTLEAQLNEADSGINELSSTASDTKAFLDRLSQYASSGNTQLDIWDRRIAELQTAFGNVNEDLSDISSSTDQSELSPIQFSNVEVIRNSNTINIFFPAIMGIDMILASLLLPIIAGVSMKNQGMDQRIRDSFLGAFNFVAGRFIGNYFISLLQLLILTAVGIFVFGVGHIQSLAGAILVLLLVPAVFTSFGILLSLFVKKESTAILLSLLISIPSIFLSGAILPIEVLPFPFDTLSKAMPLYSVTGAVSKTVIKGLGIFDSIFEILYLALFSLACILCAYVVRKMQE